MDDVFPSPYGVSFVSTSVYETLKTWMVSVPLRGFLCFYVHPLTHLTMDLLGFRPLTGFLLFLHDDNRRNGGRTYGVSVPLRGFLCFYPDVDTMQMALVESFRPLTGFPLFLQCY